MNKNEVWDFILENEIATEAELHLITCINGYNLQALNDVIYTRTAYPTVEQYIEYELEDYNEQNH